MPDPALDDAPTESSGREHLRYYARRLQRHPLYQAASRPLRLATHVIPAAWRLATHGLRRLPTAVIVGAQKAGTTQLYAYVTQHPDCLGAASKEVSYFSKYPHRSLGWYRSHFPWKRSARRGPSHCMEASPSYLPMPGALRRMHAALPDARVIVILRDPVARAFSHYQHQKTRHRESRGFAEIVQDAIEHCPFPPRLGVALQPDAEPMLDYVARGYYALQVELLLQLYPRERVLILDSADLFDDTSATCRRVFEFLGLPPHVVHPEKIYNKGRYRETIDAAAAERLRQHYRPYDELLVELLGWPLRWMRPPGAGTTAKGWAA